MSFPTMPDAVVAPDLFPEPSRGPSGTPGSRRQAGGGPVSVKEDPSARGSKRARTKAGPKTSRRRLTHNASEQRRVKRISAQVDKLREVLRAADRSGKNDKCSVLAATVDYVSDLEAEVKRIREQLLVQQTVASQSVGTTPTGEMLNYAQLFKAGGIAQVVSSPSGEFLDCNEMFSQMSGFPREEITKFTMFHLTPPSQLPSMYQHVGQLLSGTGPDSVQFTKTCIVKECQVEAFVVMKIVRDDAGMPQYFVCSVMPLRRAPLAGDSRTSCFQQVVNARAGGYLTGASAPATCGLPASAAVAAATSPASTHSAVAAPSVAHSVGSTSPVAMATAPAPVPPPPIPEADAMDAMDLDFNFGESMEAMLSESPRMA